MKQVNLSWLTEPIHLDRLAARALFADDDDDLTLVIKQIRDFYDKTWKAVPDHLQPIIDRIQLVLRYELTIDSVEVIYSTCKQL